MSFRFDYDPNKGSHLNAEVATKGVGGQNVVKKFAVKMSCSGRPCSEETMYKFVKKFFR